MLRARWLSTNLRMFGVEASAGKRSSKARPKAAFGRNQSEQMKSPSRSRARSRKRID